MPAQKRPAETTNPPPSPPPQLKEENTDDSLQDRENHNHEHTVKASDSDASSYSSGAEKDEFIVVKLAEIRKEVQCPICLGIIRKTRTVMECLHRFCRECIDKSMRLGNNECPACRTHCASRRSLRDDPNYDALIAAMYTDIDKYEEEELAFHEEEKARNKQIQASISQTFRRQAEALGKKRTSARVTAAALVRRQGNYRNLRGQRNHQLSEHQESDEEEGANGNYGSKDSSSADERSPNIKTKRYKRRLGARTSQSADVGSDDNDSDTNLVGGSVALIGSAEILSWGRGGMRSNTRHGGHSWFNIKLSRTNRLAQLIDHLQSSKENEELKISLMLVSLLESNIPSLKRPYICCSARSSVRHLCQYVAMQTSMEATEVEILIMKDFQPGNNPWSLKNKLSACQNELQLLNEHQTLGEIHESFARTNLVLAYRQKEVLAKEIGEDGTKLFLSKDTAQL